MSGTTPDPTSGPRRRPGRDAIIAAADDALGTADLDRLIHFLGPRPLARAAGISPGTITHHFESTREIAEETIEQALERFLPEGVHEMLLDAIEKVESDRDGMFAMVRDAAEMDFAYSASQVSANSAYFLACIAAPNDPGAAALVRGHYDRYRSNIRWVYAAIAARLGRGFDEAHGFTPESVATLMTALVDGFVLLHRFDPERPIVDLYVETTLRLFEAATVPLAEPELPTVEDRLVAHAPGAAEQVGATASDEYLASVRAAVALYDEGGWESLHPHLIAARAGLRPGAVAGILDGRAGAANLVWQARFLPQLVDDFAGDIAVDGDAVAAIKAHQRRLVRITHRHPRLSGAMIGHLLDRAARTAGVTSESAEPLYDVLLPYVDPHIAAHITHGTITGAVLDRGPTERTADRLTQGWDIPLTVDQ